MILQFKIFEPYSDKIEQGITKDYQEVEGGIVAEQIHTDEILEVDEKPADTPECDAFMTKTPGVPLVIKVADCQGVLMYDPVNNAIAAVHSGWKGSSLNIIGKTIERMEERFGSDPADLRVAISPSLGPCCSEFSDPKTELPDFVQPFVNDNNHVDFWALSRKQCKDAGVPTDQLEVTEHCTKCLSQDYYSYRRGDTGRMGVFIKLI